MAYGDCEPGFGFLKLGGQPKPTTGGTGSNYGNTLAYDRATDQWKKAVAGSLKPFGFNHTNVEVSHTIDAQTGIHTVVVGAADANATLSVVTAGRIELQAGGAIPPGELVMPDATAPVTKVQAWDGVARTAVIGRYIRNITQHHNVDTLPAAALDDKIIVDIEKGDV